MRSSLSHPIISSSTDQRKNIKHYGNFIDSKRTWVQRRAAHVYKTRSVFSINSRPSLPTAILSMGDANVLRQRKKAKLRRKRLRNNTKMHATWNIGVSKSPDRVVPGGNHFSMLATSSVKREWESSLPSVNHNNDIIIENNGSNIYGDLNGVRGNNCSSDGGSQIIPSANVNYLNPQDTEGLFVFLFSKLNAIMNVYKLRGKDLFSSIDRNSDGIIGKVDMYESLQVLGVDLLPSHAAKLIRFIVRQSNVRELNFHAFQLCLRRSNQLREKSISRRMNHYAGSQNAISNRILQSQTIKAHQFVASGSTELDATKSIKDLQGKLFWKEKFSCHTTSISLKRFMKELKMYFNRRNNNHQLSPDDDWVYRRIQSFVTTGISNQLKVSATSFGQLLQTFGPMNRLKSNVLAGPLLSNATKKKLRHQKKGVIVKT